MRLHVYALYGHVTVLSLWQHLGCWASQGAAATLMLDPAPDILSRLQRVEVARGRLTSTAALCAATARKPISILRTEFAWSRGQTALVTASSPVAI
ncbi:hypothetical protein V1511DRAFT_492025 [Dipodascopsis uninucleata]